jgi:two-component system, NarL family, sensor histidine kinase UhpB
LPRATSPVKRDRSRRQPAPPPVGPTLEELSKLLARELHDSVAQTLSTMLIELENFREEQYGRAGVLRQVDLLEQSTRKALLDLRRLLVDLRAEEFGEEDLVRLIKRALLDRRGRSRSVAFGLRVAPEWPERIPASAALEIFRLVTEAVDNAIRHSAAKTIDVALSLDDQAAVVSITDDGRGLPVDGEFNQPAGLGIRGMRERALLLGGEVRLEGGPRGRGTCVRLTLPTAALVRPAV